MNAHDYAADAICDFPPRLLRNLNTYASLPSLRWRGACAGRLAGGEEDGRQRSGLCCRDWGHRAFVGDVEGAALVGHIRAVDFHITGDHDRWEAPHCDRGDEVRDPGPPSSPQTVPAAIRAQQAAMFAGGLVVV